MGVLAGPRGSFECSLAFGDNPDRHCAWCGTDLPKRRRRWCSDACDNEFGRNHAWNAARPAALRRDDHRCTREGCDSRLKLEVNHRTPILGRHHEFGCHHHLAGLETLCHRHHVDVTNAQRAARRAGHEGSVRIDTQQLDLVVA